LAPRPRVEWLALGFLGTKAKLPVVQASAGPELGSPSAGSGTLLEALLRDGGVLEARLNATLNAVEFYRSLGYRDEVPTVNSLPTGVELPCVAMRKTLN
jgi:hypothetical protein